MTNEVNIFWFRRDLRLEDNKGLYKALRGKYPVLTLFIFDEEILEKIPETDPRVRFIHDRLIALKAQLKDEGSDLAVHYGNILDVFQTLQAEFSIQHVIANHDYEPYALQRDQKIATYLKERNIGFHTFKDQVIFEKDEITKADGSPYIVYTPYSKQWLERWKEQSPLQIYDPTPYLSNLLDSVNFEMISLEAMGFKPSNQRVQPYNVSENTLVDYELNRNFPGKMGGTSNLSPHLRFGTVGIRSLVNKAGQIKNITFLKELIWREFFMQILWHFPHTVHQSFKPQYDRIEWKNNEADFEKWKQGKTGYPIVDAGMRELNATGYMHNRVRMIVASFLCKHLLIDWRWGEAYFAEKLLDFELSSNVGNWQWAAGSGVDAAPYFRIFNPTTQMDKFDKDRIYVTKWVPEWQSDYYPQPMVEHSYARERCLKTYKEALN
jgi:deoxyribodipyrimidine photo-lyase